MIQVSIVQLRMLLGFCVAVYFFGAIGMLSPLDDWFIGMTPLSLFLSYITLLLHQNDDSQKVMVYWLVAFGVGYGIEVLGVNTGWPFGHYTYGNVLGAKLFHTPLMLGVNWTLVTYCSFYTIDQLLPKLHASVFVPLAALLPTAVDFLIEPVAIQLGMWAWPSDLIPPIQNYLGWYGTSFFLAIVWRSTVSHNLVNRAAILLLILQLGFFTILGLLL